MLVGMSPCHEVLKIYLIPETCYNDGHVSNPSQYHDDDVQHQKCCVGCLVNSSVLLDLLNLSLYVAQACNKALIGWNVKSIKKCHWKFLFKTHI